MIVSKLKLFFFTIFVIPHLIVYLLAIEKASIEKDVEAFLCLQKRTHNRYIVELHNLLILCYEFRNVFYMRVGPRYSHILKMFLSPIQTLNIGVESKNCGGGFLVQHGNSTIVLAESIGENFWVNQNVTVGWTEDGCPTIGNNVRIGTGAVVLGPIQIGDNVKIGAGAIVVKDVPSNCTVVSPHAYIVKKDGVKVNKPL